MDFEPSVEERAIAERVRAFAARVLAPAADLADAEHRFDTGIVPQLGALGVLGGALPRAVGGSGWSHVGCCLAFEELGAIDSSWRGFVTVQGALCGLCLNDHGTAGQKAARLPALASGREIFAYALTESGAGTDVAALATRATEDRGGWRISGEKVWITNGGVADWILVFATTDPALKHRGITCFLVPGDAPGLTRKAMPNRDFGHRAANHAHLVFDGVRVGPEDVVGRVGEGFKVAMGGLEHGRLGVAAGAVGVHRACLEICVDFARRRRQFGQRIGDFQLLQGVLADLHVTLEASRLLTHKAASLRDRGLQNLREVSVAKYVAVENAVRAANEAMLFLGSRGYSDASPVGRHLRDIKGMQIYEGTSHVQKVIIARDLLGKDQGETL